MAPWPVPSSPHPPRGEGGAETPAAICYHKSNAEGAPPSRRLLLDVTWEQHGGERLGGKAWACFQTHRRCEGAHIYATPTAPAGVDGLVHRSSHVSFFLLVPVSDLLDIYSLWDVLCVLTDSLPRGTPPHVSCCPLPPSQSSSPATMEIVIPPRDHGPSTFRYTWDENGEVQQMTRYTHPSPSQPPSPN